MTPATSLYLGQAYVFISDSILWEIFSYPSHDVHLSSLKYRGLFITNVDNISTDSHAHHWELLLHYVSEVVRMPRLSMTAMLSSISMVAHWLA